MRRSLVWLLGLCLIFLFVACKQEKGEYAFKREGMVSRQIAARGVSNRLVLEAMRKVPRHEFVPDGVLLFSVGLGWQAGLNDRNIPEGLRQEFGINGISLSQNVTVSIRETDSEWRIDDGGRAYVVLREEGELRIYADSMRRYAYEDRPLPIGEDQTISQPYIVALMTEVLELEGDERILEIGTGSGYQAAILAEIVKEVYTIEIVESLARTAEERLKGMGYKNITVRFGDGYKGWVEHEPFDGVIVTCAPDHVPQPLVDQLKVGGRMVIPVGDRIQELVLLTKTEAGMVRKNIAPVRFVPMTGEAQQK